MRRLDVLIYSKNGNIRRVSERVQHVKNLSAFVSKQGTPTLKAATFDSRSVVVRDVA